MYICIYLASDCANDQKGSYYVSSYQEEDITSGKPEAAGVIASATAVCPVGIFSIFNSNRRRFENRPGNMETALTL